jgi:hypothetical protein
MVGARPTQILSINARFRNVCMRRQHICNELVRAHDNMYACPQNAKTGEILPPRTEMDGSHNITCNELQDGCR